MTQTSLTRARSRAAAFRAESAAARQRRASRDGRASDDLVTMTVDDLGQLVSVTFEPSVVETTPDRWAGSVLAVHRRACAAVRSSGVGPPTGPPTHAAGPAATGHPIAGEEADARASITGMVARFQGFSARQGTLTFTGSAREVWLTFDGALGLQAARVTPAALRRGPASLAAAVAGAWQDARRQLTAAIGLDRTS